MQSAMQGVLKVGLMRFQVSNFLTFEAVTYLYLAFMPCINPMLLCILVRSRTRMVPVLQRACRNQRKIWRHTIRIYPTTMLCCGLCLPSVFSGHMDSHEAAIRYRTAHHLHTKLPKKGTAMQPVHMLHHCMMLACNVMISYIITAYDLRSSSPTHRKRKRAMCIYYTNQTCSKVRDTVVELTCNLQ